MKPSTVQQISAEIGVDADDVIIALWDHGFDKFDDPQDRLEQKHVRCVQEAFGLPRRSKATSPEYWKEALRLDDKAFAQMLAALDIQMSPAQRRLPKGSVRRLRSLLRTKGHQEAKMAEAPLPQPAPPRAKPPLSELIGHKRLITYISAKDVEEIHYAIAKDFAAQADPIAPAGVRDYNLLASAVERPMTSLAGHDKYPTVEMAGAALLHSLVFDHAFINGNKRTGLVSLLVFLDENGFVLTCKEKELFDFVLRLTERRLPGQTRDEQVRLSDPWAADAEVEAMTRWLVTPDRCREMDKSERPIRWWRLKRILRGYGCTFSNPHKGNAIDIERVVQRPSRSGASQETLSVQVHCAGESSEANRNEVTQIRRALELESYDFYSNKADQIDFWIDKYRRTLRRLAKR